MGIKPNVLEFNVFLLQPGLDKIYITVDNNRFTGYGRSNSTSLLCKVSAITSPFLYSLWANMPYLHTTAFIQPFF